MKFIDKINQLVGHAVAWLIVVMVLGTFYNVVARYFFESFSLPLGELIIDLNAVVFLLASPLLLYLDQHVRVDVFYGRFSPRLQAIVDFFGTLFLLLPFCGFVIYYSWSFVVSSWRNNEASGETGGLPALYLLKSLIIIFAVLLFLQGLSMLIKKLALIKNPTMPHIEHHHEEAPL